MYNFECDVAIVGGGPAGLSAAVAAKKEDSAICRRSAQSHAAPCCGRGQPLLKAEPGCRNRLHRWQNIYD